MVLIVISLPTDSTKSFVLSESKSQALSCRFLLHIYNSIPFHPLLKLQFFEISPEKWSRVIK